MEAYRQMLSFCHRRGTKKKVQRLSRAFVYHILRCSGEREGKGGWERKGREGGMGVGGRRGGALKEVNYIRFAY